MCLAKAYKNEDKPENICMDNVMQIEFRDGVTIITDIFGRCTEIKGLPIFANFDQGKAVIREIN